DVTRKPMASTGEPNSSTTKRAMVSAFSSALFVIGRRAFGIRLLFPVILVLVIVVGARMAIRIDGQSHLLGLRYANLPRGGKARRRGLIESDLHHHPGVVQVFYQRRAEVRVAPQVADIGITAIHVDRPSLRERVRVVPGYPNARAIKEQGRAGRGQG